jgi:hypothetical protein
MGLPEQDKITTAGDTDSGMAIACCGSAIRASHPHPTDIKMRERKRNVRFI